MSHARLHGRRIATDGVVRALQHCAPARRRWALAVIVAFALTTCLGVRAAGQQHLELEIVSVSFLAESLGARTEASVLSDPSAARVIVSDPEVIGVYQRSMARRRKEVGRTSRDMRAVVILRDGLREMDRLSFPVPCTAMFHNQVPVEIDRDLFWILVDRLPGARLITPRPKSCASVD